MPISFSEWKKQKAEGNKGQAAQTTQSTSSTQTVKSGSGPIPFSQWKQQQNNAAVPATAASTTQQTNLLDLYKQKLDFAQRSYDSAKNKYRTPTFDETYAGYATDPVSVENMRTNKSGKTDKAELNKRYDALQKAKSDYSRAQQESSYWDLMSKHMNNPDAVINDLKWQIQQAKKNPVTSKDPSKPDPSNAKLKELEKQLESFTATNTQYKNAADDYVLLQSWMKGNKGTVASYNQAKEAYDQADADLKALEAQDSKLAGARNAGWTGLPDNELGDKIAEAYRKRDQARMIMDYAYTHQYDELKNASDYDLKADEGELKFQEYKQQPVEYTQSALDATAIGGTAESNSNPYALDTGYKEPDDRWTEEEKKNFYYLFDDDQARAEEYAVQINGKYNSGEAAERDLSTEEFAQRNFGTGFIASAGSVPANLAGGLADYARMISEMDARGGLYETQYDGLSRWADTTRSAIANSLNEYGTINNDVPVLGGKGVGDLYQLMMSMVDSSVAVAAGGGPANVIFFGSAAASGTRQALDRGIPADKALAIGFFNGAAEVLGETLSVEHLLKQGDIADYLRNGLLKEMLKQGAVEGSEEVLTTILNTIADAVINGDDSEFQQNVYVNMQNGMSYDDAVRKARMDWLSDLGADALGGVLSGGLMFGGRMGLQSASAAVTTYQGDTRGLMDIAKLTGEDSKTSKLAAKYQERYEKTGSLSNLQAAKLDVSAADELQAKDRTALTTQVKQRLEALEVENSEKAAKAIVDRLLGEKKGAVGKLSDSSIFKDSRVRIAYQEAMEQLGGRNTTASWLDDSGLMTLGKDPAVGRTMENRLKLVKLKGSDERVEIKKAGMQGDNLTITYEQGGEDKTVTTDDLDLDDYQREALQAMVDILGDDAAYAFNGMRNSQRQMLNLRGISNYATEFAAIRDVYGRNGTNIEAALKSPMRQMLSDGQVMQAYERGKELGPVKAGDGTAVARGTGEISLEGGILDGHRMGAVKDQAAVRNSDQFKLLQRIAKRIGWDMVIYESEAVDEKGNLGYAPRGAYVQDGKIWLDWNAGVNNIKNINDTTKWMIFLTMSHEVTHFLEENAKKEYAELRKFIEKHLAEHKGHTFADAMNDKMADRIDAINRGEVDRDGKPLKPMTADEAAREVIADACETMLVRSEYIGMMVEEAPGLFQKLRKAIRAFFDNLLGKNTDGYDSSLRLSKETRAIQDVADEVSKLWDAALKAAVENRVSAETLQESPTFEQQASADVRSANELVNELQQKILRDAKNPTASAQQMKIAQLMQQIATVNRETPVPRQALPPHQEQQAQQEKPAQAPKLTAKEKAAIKRRFNDAVDKLMESYLYENVDISREDAERMITEYAALHDGYFSELDEWQQKGLLKTQKQYARDFYESLEADEAEAFENLEGDSQELVALMGEGTTIESNDDGEMEIAVSEDRSTIAYSPRTYMDGGKEKLIAALKQNGHTTDEINETVDLIEDAMDYLQILAAGYAKNTGYTTLSEHLLANVTTYIKSGSKAKQALSTIVNNGDYPVNLDLALICKKRVAYMRLMNKLIEDGIFDQVNFGGSAIAEVNTILRNNGFETACLGCFVESRRLQLQNWAETIVEEWNAEVDKRNSDPGSFGFAEGKTDVVAQEDVMALVNELEKAGKKNAKGNLNLGKGSVQTKMGRLLDKVPSLQRHLTVADLLNPKGLTALRAYDQNLFSLVKQRYGAASPKIVQDFNPYNSEIASLSFNFVKDLTGNAVKGAQRYKDQAKKEFPQQKGESKNAYNKRIEDEAMKRYLYDIGGARIQSFSDFMIENVFDYLQIFADLSARRFPLHGYTKEATCLRLFGMTGAKWNGSLIAHVDSSMGKEYAGLLPASEASNGRGVVVTVDGKKYAICADDYARHVATGSFIQSIGMKDIFALQLDPRYSSYVGSITIGVSDKQILAMLDSDLFRMVIPYHASGMLPEYAKLVGVDTYNDYTEFQNTRVKACIDLNGNVVDGFYDKDGEKIKIDTSYAYNREVQRTGDARKAAANYVAWCAQKHPVYNGKKLVGYAIFDPKFSNSPYGTDFTKHPNYYKLLEDFNSYDNLTGASALQGAVQMRLPSEATRLTPAQLDAYKQALRDTGLYSEKEIDKYARKAQQTFKEIIADEVKGRSDYESAQAKVWDSTIQEVEDTLLNKFPQTAEERSQQRAKKAGKVQLSARMSYDQFSAEDYYKDGRMYDYDFLVAQKDMKVSAMPPLSAVKVGNKISRDKAADLGMKNLASVGTKDGDVYAVKNKYTGRAVYTGINSLRHSMKGDNIGLLRTNARLSAIAGDLIQNAIPINALKNENDQSDGTYAMITLANSGDRVFAVVIHVEQHNNIQRMEAVDITHSISGRIKKENRSASRAQPLGNESYGLPQFSDINIAELLDIVKETYRGILSVSVQNHYGKAKLEEGYYTGRVLYSSRADNLGYHAGDLGKAEHLNIQGRYRGTGHFGTGTYFVGEEEKVTKDSHYGKRPQHAVDFTDYNLYKVRSDREGYQLHDFLRIIDGGIKQAWIRPALDNQFNIISPTGYYDLAKSKYGDDWTHGDNLLNAMLEYAANNGISIKTLDEYKADEGNGLDDSDVKDYYEEYVKDTVKKEIDSVNEEYREFMDAIWNIHLIPGFTNSKLFSALTAVADYQAVTPRNARVDSYATVFMKAMGYEGVDVRGTRLDNTEYGSVIYDVKPETVQYSARTKMDRDYMEAVERGDMEMAQRMVDEAAAAAGYNRRAFHGTVSKFWTFRRGKEGIHFGTLEVAQQTLEKDRSRHGLSSYPLGIIRANLDRFNAEQLWNLSEELENLKWRGYSDIPSLDPKTVYDNAEAVRGYMDKILELHPEARSDAKIDMKDMFDEHQDRMIDAYIKMQHPMIVPVDIGEWTTWSIASALLHKLNGTTDSFYKYNREEKSGDWTEWNPADIKGIELTEADRPALENLAGHYKEYEELVDFLHSKGVDSIEYTNMYEGTEDNISYLLLDPEQVKLADPVTYDDAGNVIPLSERFNSGTGDIRFSARTDAKSDRELLLDASEAGMTDAEKRAAADYKAKVDVFRQRQQAATTALDALDKAVQAGNATEANKLRAKLTAAEKKMSEALAALTEAERGPELRAILRREREIQRQRTTRHIRDSYNRRELRQRVDRLWKDLNKRITSPTEKKRIPVELMQQAVDVLQVINMDTTREGSQGGQKLRNKLLELRARYTELQNDPDFRRASVYDAQVAQYLDNMIEVVGDTPINRMSTEQLAAVYNTLAALDHTARNAVKVKLRGQEIEAYEVSKYMTAETRSVGKKKTGAIETWINAQLSPARMFNRFGGYTKNSYWSRVYEMLDEGQLKQTQLMMEGSLIFEDLLQGKDYEKFIDPKNTVDVGLIDENGNNIAITHGMMVALYMHLQNEQNARHVAYGGLTIPALKDYYSGKKVKGSENAVRVGGVLQEMADLNDRIRNEEDVDILADLEAQRDELSVRALDMIGNLQATIETKLTDYDRQWIAASKELFDGFSKRVLNQTTLEVYGIKRANVENYMPIWVDGDFLNSPFESVAKDMSLENAGFMKERVDSSKPIRLADISDVTASQIRKVSQYCGLMPAIRAFNKVWGKTQTGYRDSLQKAVHEMYGQNGVKYIENLMADLNGARGTEDSALGEFLNRMRGHMAQASLTLSLRVALGQTASYPTAAAVLGWDALNKALVRGGKDNAMISRADQELIRKWSPLLYYRMKGYSMPELGDIAGMNSKWDLLWKKARWATGWIQAMDGATVGRLWYAAEYYVQDHNKALVKGTDAYYEAVAKKFNEAVELTQPNYTTMQRPDILRNPNALVKQLTMFLTQRLQNFNILYDAAATYSKYRSDFREKKNGVTAEDVRQAGVATRTAALSQVAAAATITAFKFLADVLLHSMSGYRDDDDDLTKASISIELLDMFIDSLAGNVLGGGELYDVIESKAFGKTYYGIEVSGVSTVTDLITTANTVFDHVAQGKASAKDLDLLAKRLGPVAGIPYANALKIVNGGRYWVEDAINGELFSFEAGVDRTTAQQAHRLYRAYTAMDYGQVKKIRAEVADDAAVNKALTDYIKKQYADGKINRFDAQRQLVKYVGKDAEAAEKMIREYSAEVETGIKFSQIEDQFLLGDIDAAKARQMLVKYGGMDAATAQMKVDFWSYQNKHAGSTLEFSSYKTYVNKYKPIGLSVEQYEDYSERLRDCKGVDANGDGKTDSGSKKKEVVALIDSLSLSTEQKDQLYFANNYGASGLKDTPWHK